MDGHNLFKSVVPFLLGAVLKKIQNICRAAACCGSGNGSVDRQVLRTDSTFLSLPFRFLPDADIKKKG
jgi:hypothetical protein